MIAKYLKLNRRESKAFNLHLIYSTIEGVIEGILALNEFVLVKSLHGSNYQIGFLFQLGVIVLIFSVIFNELLKRAAKKRRLLRIVGIATRLPLVLLLFFPTNPEVFTNNYFYQYVFLIIFLIYFSARPLIFPTINLLLKNSYRHHIFGKLYSYATSLNKIVMLIVTFLFGILLDINNFAFVWVYPILAVLGIVSIFILSRIEYQNPESNIIKSDIKQAVAASFRNMITIIKTNIPYRDFEIGFMLYGFAWMSTAGVIVIYLDKQLGISYSGIAFYKNSYNIIAILMLPFFGKLLSKIDPRKFAIITFSTLLFFLLFMAGTEFFPYYSTVFGIKIYYSLVVSYFFYGLFAATMALLWSIGSAYFCKNEDAGSYQSVHLSLTGFRGIISPLIGIFFLEHIGYLGAFALAILSLSAAVILMILSIRKKYKSVL